MPPKQKRRGPVPEKPGKARQYLMDTFSLPDDPSELEICRNGHVLYFFVENDNSSTRTAEWVNDKFGFKPTKHQIQSLANRCIPMFRHISRDAVRQKFEGLCLDAFVLHYPPPETAPNPESTEPSPSSNAPSVDPVPSTSFAVTSTSSAASPSPDSVPSTLLAVPSTDPIPSTSSAAQLTSPPTKKLRGMDLTPTEEKLKRRLSFLAQSKAQQTKKLQDMRKKMKERPYLIKLLKQKVKRKESTIQSLKTALKTSDTRKKLQKAHARIKRLSQQVSVLKQKYNKLKSDCHTEFKLKLKEKDEIIENQKWEKDILEENLESLSCMQKETHSTKRDNKSYSLRTRTMIYDMVLCQVPTRHISSLFQKLMFRVGMSLENIPHRSTIEMMVRELGIITDLQAAEIAMTTPDLTLGMDATTQEGIHMNCIHFTTKESCFVIAVDQLPGGTADDYHQHICETFDHVAKVYSDFHGADYQECRSIILSNVKNTMTDRAVVNRATVSKLNTSWHKSLNELNCHLHPLDSIATGCRSALKALEGEKGRLYGKYCSAGNIVLQMNKMRYKDGKGDPKGFKIFLDDNHLPKGILPRYRGNRLHILFHSCAILVQHYNLFLDFLTTGSVSCGELQTSLRHDFTSDTARREMCVLGLLGKLLTGPWMTKFYVSADKQEIDHVGGIEIVRGVVDRVAEQAKNPLGMFSTSTDFFGNMVDDAALKALQLFCPKDQETEDIALCCLSEINTVLQRQYVRYFSLDVTEQLRKETESARLHNIDAEEMMGMFSAAHERSPNATLDFLSSKLRASKNKVLKYLDSMEVKEQKKVVEWAVGAARKKRTTRCLRHDQLREELSRRSMAKKQKKEEKERSKIEKILKTLTVECVKDTFPELEEKAFTDLSDIINDKIVGRSLCHLWYDAETEYYGRIEKVKPKKATKVYVVAYWAPKETYDDAIDFELDKYQLAADVVCGDLILS